VGECTNLYAGAEAGTNVAYAWNFGDETNGSGDEESHCYSWAGIYAATVTAFNPVSMLTATTAVTITDVPPSGLMAFNSSPTELGNPTTLWVTIDSGTGVAYVWHFGDGTPPATGWTVNHEYEALGVYTATVRASNTADVISTTTTVTITDMPIEGLKAHNDGPTEFGTSTMLWATREDGTNVAYEWVFGDGSERQSGILVFHLYDLGTFTATVVATNSVSEDSATTTVMVVENTYLPIILRQ